MTTHLSQALYDGQCLILHRLTSFPSAMHLSLGLGNWCGVHAVRFRILSKQTKGTTEYARRTITCAAAPNNSQNQLARAVLTHPDSISDLKMQQHSAYEENITAIASLCTPRGVHRAVVIFPRNSLFLFRKDRIEDVCGVLRKQTHDDLSVERECSTSAVDDQAAHAKYNEPSAINILPPLRIPFDVIVDCIYPCEESSRAPCRLNAARIYGVGSRIATL